MKTFLTLLAFCCGGFFGGPAPTPSPSPSPVKKVSHYVEGEMLVKFRSGVTKEQIEAFNAAHGVRVLGFIEGIRVYRLGLPPGKTVPEMTALYQASPLVEYAEPNHRLHLNGGLQ